MIHDLKYSYTCIRCASCTNDCMLKITFNSTTCYMFVGRQTATERNCLLNKIKAAFDSHPSSVYVVCTVYCVKHVHVCIHTCSENVQ